MATKQLTPDEPRERAEQLRAQATQAEAAVRQQADAEWERANAARAAWDQRFLDTWDRASLDAEVERTRAELERALEEDPLVQALAAHLAAEQRLRWMVSERIDAQGRLGRDVSGAQYPSPPTMLSVADHVRRVAERLASDAVRQERENLANDRENLAK